MISTNTYSIESGQFWEVVQRLETTAVEADHLKLAKLFEVGLVFGAEALDWCLIQNQIVKLQAA